MHPPGVDVAGVRLHRLVITQDLSGGRRWHRGEQQRVPDTVLGHLLLEAAPVVQAGRRDAPHVVLQLALADRAAGIRLVRSLLLGQLAARLYGSVVDRLEDLLVQQLSLLRLEGEPHQDEGVSESLDTDADGPVSHVAPLRLLDRVVVDVNDFVEVLGGNLSDLFESVEVVSLVRLDESIDSDGGEVADGDFIGAGVLDDLGAEVGTLDCAEILLVGLPVAGVLVQHVGGARLDLALNDRVPHLLGLDLLPCPTLLLVPLVQFLELLAPHLMKPGTLVGTHERPHAILLHPFHEEVWNPESKEEIPGSLLLLAVILAKVQKVKNVSVPRLKVDRKGSRPLITSLVDVPGRVVKDSQHGDQTIRRTVSAGNVRSTGPDAMYVEADPAGRLGDESTLFQGVVDTLDGVGGHGEEETGGELGTRSGSVEEGGRGVGETLLGQHVVRFDSGVDIFSMDTDSHAH